MNKLTVIAIPVLALIIAGLTFFGYGEQLRLLFVAGTDNAYVRRDVIVVQSPVAGRVSWLPYEDGSPIAAGKPIAIIEQRQAEIDIAGSRSRGRASELEADNYQASARATAEQINALRDQHAGCLQSEKLNENQVHRIESLVSRGFATAAAADQARSALQERRIECLGIVAQLRAVRLQGSNALASFEEARSHALQAHAETKRSEDLVDRAKILAPYAAILGSRRVSVGSEVQVGTPLAALISRDKVWVEANFREDQLASLTIGTPVIVTASSFRNHEFRGRVAAVGAATAATFAPASLRSSAGAYTKVTQWVPVRIALNNDPETIRLPAGVSCTVRVASR